MKRYDLFGSLDGGGPAEACETADGGWVRYEDAAAALAAERERCVLAVRRLESDPAYDDWDHGFRAGVDAARRAIQGLR